MQQLDGCRVVSGDDLRRERLQPSRHFIRGRFLLGLLLLALLLLAAVLLPVVIVIAVIIVAIRRTAAASRTPGRRLLSPLLTFVVLLALLPGVLRVRPLPVGVLLVLLPGGLTLRLVRLLRRLLRLGEKRIEPAPDPVAVAIGLLCPAPLLVKAGRG